MGLFEKAIEIPEKYYDKINSLLPEKLQRKIWTSEDITDGKINRMIGIICETINSEIEVLSKQLINFEKNTENKIASGIKIFNVETYNAEPIGMVDIGLVKRFGSASTGNRFENGVIGYAIESAADNMWAQGSEQQKSVEEVKLELLKKTLKIYPNCNTLFKFEIDFRELGSSGNVFIYARGTASIGNNPYLDEVKEKQQNEYQETNKSIKEKNEYLELLYKNKKLFPSTRKELIHFLNINK